MKENGVRFEKVLALLCVSAGVAAVAHAKTWVTLETKDGPGQSSLIEGERWSSKAVPDKDHDYLVQSVTLRTPDIASANTVFEGNSLQIGEIGGATTAKILVKGNKSTVEYAHEGLFLANGSYAIGADQLESTIAGTVTVLSPDDAAFQITSEYGNWSRFLVTAAVKSEAGTRLKISGTSDAMREFEVRLSGNLSDYRGTLSIAHDEATLTFSGQTLPGDVSVDADGAVLSARSADTVTTVGGLALAKAGGILQVWADDAEGTNSVFCITRNISVVAGTKVRFVAADGEFRFLKPRYPLLVLSPSVTDAVDPSAFVCVNEQTDDQSVAFGVERKSDGSRVVFAYPCVRVTAAIDGGSVSLTQTIASGETKSVALAGLEDLFSDAVLHLDAANEESVVHHTERQAEVVTSWNGKEPYQPGRANDPKLKALPTYRTTAINGLSRKVVDFGEWNSAFSTAAPDGSTAAAMPLDATSAVEFYSVVADASEDSGKRCVLGFGYKDARGEPDNYPFRRDGAKILNAVKANSCESLVKGGIYVDGVPATADYVPSLGEFHAYAFYPTQTISFNAVACGKYDGFGGEQIGELVAFRTANSDARREAIRRILQRKWLGTGALIDIPVEEIGVTGAGTLALDCGDYCAVRPTGLSFGMPTQNACGKIVASGTYVLSSSGTVRISVADGKRIRDGRYVLVEATNLTGAENAANWSVDAGPRNAGRGIMLEVIGNQLVMTVPASGIIMVVR